MTVDPKGLALVTGASSGLGRELARLFAAAGHDLVLVARREPKLRELQEELQERHGITAQVLTADLADPAAPATIEAALEDRPVDYLVNNAGFGTTGPFTTLDRARELAMIQVNVTSLVDLTHRFAARMRERGRGRVLNIASTAGFQPGPGMATYFATKAYVLSFTEALAHELRGTGVTATVHCPGATATEFAQEAGNDKTLLFRLSVADATSVARHAYRSMMKGRVVAIPGILNWLAAQAVRLGPRFLVRFIAARLNR